MIVLATSLCFCSGLAAVSILCLAGIGTRGRAGKARRAVCGGFTGSARTGTGRWWCWFTILAVARLLMCMYVIFWGSCDGIMHALQSCTAGMV